MAQPQVYTRGTANGLPQKHSIGGWKWDGPRLEAHTSVPAHRHQTRPEQTITRGCMHRKKSIAGHRTAIPTLRPPSAVVRAHQSTTNTGLYLPTKTAVAGPTPIPSWAAYFATMAAAAAGALPKKNNRVDVPLPPQPPDIRMDIIWLSLCARGKAGGSKVCRRRSNDITTTDCDLETARPVL